MKIREIISEAGIPKLRGKIKKLSTDITEPMPGTFVQKDLRNTDPYMQYRYGVAVSAAMALKNGHIETNEYEQESEFAENLTQIAYATEEEEIVRLASQLMGVTPTRIANSKSRETNLVNTVSPVAKKKPNKYGV